jgi:hypothetical protein
MERISGVFKNLSTLVTPQREPIDLKTQLKSFSQLQGELAGSRMKNVPAKKSSPFTLCFDDYHTENEYQISRYRHENTQGLRKVYLLLAMLLCAHTLSQYFAKEKNRLGKGDQVPLAINLCAVGYLLLQRSLRWRNVQRVVLFSAIVIAGALICPLQFLNVETAEDMNRYHFELGIRSVVFKAIGCSLLLLSSARFLFVAMLETGYFLSLHWIAHSFADISRAIAVSMVSTVLFYFVARQLERKARNLFLASGRVEREQRKLEKEVRTLNFLKKTLTYGNKDGKGEKKKHQVMVSYSHKNSEVAFALEKSLSASGLFAVWIDREGIKAGADWRGQIAEAIQNSVCVIFLVSNASIISRYCQEEIYFAKVVGVPILPLTIQANMFGELSGSGGLKMILQRIQWIDFTSAFVQEGSSAKAATRRGKLEVGETVFINKQGKYAGHPAVVMDPDWNGMVKVAIDGLVKSYNRKQVRRSMEVPEAGRANTGGNTQEDKQRAQPSLETGSQEMSAAAENMASSMAKSLGEDASSASYLMRKTAAAKPNGNKLESDIKSKRSLCPPLLFPFLITLLSFCAHFTPPPSAT